MKTWIITGAGRGLGAEVARAALAAGDNVVATARDPQTLAQSFPDGGDRLHPIGLDVTDPEKIKAVMAEAIGRFDGVDVLVNNAGYGQLGAFEEISPDNIARQFATNVFGAFDVTRAVLPAMRRQRHGRIVNISSIAGIEGFEGSSIYCASKHALAGWSEGLGHEVKPFGIKVTCVYPGRFRTDFLDGSSVRYGETAIDDYAEASGAHRKELEDDNHRQLGDPRLFAAALLELAQMDEPPLHLATGSDAYAIFLRMADILRRSAEDNKALTLSTDFA